MSRYKKKFKIKLLYKLRKIHKNNMRTLKADEVKAMKVDFFHTQKGINRRQELLMIYTNVYAICVFEGRNS